MKVETVDTASGMLNAMAARVVDLTPLMEKFGQHMDVSVRSNFLQGGRPRWADLKDVIVLPKGSKSKKQRVQGRARMGGPLVLTGDLKAEQGHTAEPRDLILWARPTEDAVKAPVHQWGIPDTEHGGSGKLAGRNHTVAIPARPYLVFQPEDLVWFRSSCDGWIRVGKLA